MGWILHRSHGAARKKSDAQAQEDAIQTPRAMAKDDFWQPGEWGQWLDLEKKLLDKRNSVSKSRYDKVYEQIKSKIIETYEPNKGEGMPSTDAIEHMARSFTAVIIAYAQLPISVFAATSEEREEIMKKEPLVRHGEWDPDSKDAQDRLNQLEELWERTNTHDKKWEHFIRARIRHAMDATDSRPVGGAGVIHKGKSMVKPEVLERLIEAKKEKKLTADVLACEIRIDIAKIKSYIEVLDIIEQKISAKELDQIDIKHLRRALSLSSVDQTPLMRCVNDLTPHARQNKTCEDALRSFFQNPEHAEPFVQLSRDHEWAQDSEGLVSTVSLLESLVEHEDSEFLGKWLDFIYHQADAEATKTYHEATENLQMLYANGRYALRMNLV